ncbi:PEP/pyruvate-binding domain-containing protein [Pseudonocardia sp. H11422]|uniref:PEP/pyruvate-binding domain-containing protein n=1 Tax=Pseudonocardia sp. H11422 TaxID=2835866 RepID=UPI001BDD59FC|nr:PEP/pyruvate-binding domain-containing protein [Pseudonocardia sp. H11422]
MAYAVWFDDYVPALAGRVGGKCASLGEMTGAGLPVPPGFAITTDAHRAACAGVETRLRALLAGGDPHDASGPAAASAEARALVEECGVPGGVRAQVAAAYAELGRRCGATDVPVAVRSSATCEDSPDASFAGEHDTYLWVCGTDDVLAAVSRCWSSLYTERAISYRQRMGLAEDGVAMGVAVQKMVCPTAAGVAFTLNPQDGDRSQIAIDASWGFGEAVVAGEVTPDNYLVDKVLFEITRRTVSDKATEYRLAAHGRGVERGPVPDERRAVPCLDDEEITAVARLARRAEKHYGRPQDIEWAVDADLPAGERVLMLQSRPETVWSKRRPASVSAGTASGYAGIVSTLVSPLHGRRT